MGNGSGDDDGTNLSTASTILGLSLFCALCLAIFVRRLFLIHQGRRAWSPRVLAEADIDGLGNVGLGERPSDDEPRTIAIGGRAKTLRIPVLWETFAYGETSFGQHDPKPFAQTTSASPKLSPLETYLPLSIQMVTPHTTATVPVPSIVSTPNILPHEGTATGRPDGPHPADARPGDIQAVQSEVPTSAVAPAPHPLQLSFLISLPSSHNPQYKSRTRNDRASPALPVQPSTSYLPLIIGTTSPNPTFLLPSITMPVEELRQWWDRPPPPTSGRLIFSLIPGEEQRHGLDQTRRERNRAQEAARVQMMLDLRHAGWRVRNR